MELCRRCFKQPVETRFSNEDRCEDCYAIDSQRWHGRGDVNVNTLRQSADLPMNAAERRAQFALAV